MKFYEKIIGIDKASSHGLMTITFNNGFFEFDKGLKITGATTIAGNLTVSAGGTISGPKVSTDSFSLDNFSGPPLVMEPSASANKGDGKTAELGTLLTGDFDSASKKFYPEGNMSIGKIEKPFINGYITNLSALAIYAGNSSTSTIGTNLAPGKYIFANTLSATTANITTANITNPVDLPYKSRISNGTSGSYGIPGLSHFDKGGGWGYFHNDVDFALPTTSPNSDYNIGFRSGNLVIPSNTLTYTVTYITPLASNNFVSLTPHNQIRKLNGDPITGWISSSTKNGFTVTFSERTIAETNGRFFSYGIDTFSTVA